MDKQDVVYIHTYICQSLSHATLCDPMGCNPPGSSVHEVFQARILEIFLWVAISFSNTYICVYTQTHTHIYVYTYTHVHSGILLSHKKERNNVIFSNTDGLRDYHTKWNKSDRERQMSCDITYMWNLKRWYKWIYL